MLKLLSPWPPDRTDLFLSFLLNSAILATNAVAFKVYDMDRDGLISNGELFLVLKMMVGNNLKDQQLQQIVDKTIMEADQNGCASSSLLILLRLVVLALACFLRCRLVPSSL